MVELSADVIVFDMDDTLYLERDFARSGFQCVERFLSQWCDADGFAGRCIELLDGGCRGRVFDLALEGLEVNSRQFTMGELVEVYRSHRPSISLANDAVRLLSRLREHRTGLISDGPEVMQRQKAEALGIDHRIEHLILTGKWATGFGKPHRRAFDEIEQWSGRSGPQVAYIADNAAKDFLAPRMLGWQTIQILREGRIHHGIPPSPEYAADHQIDSLDHINLR